MSTKALNFRYGYEVHDVSPLPHYYEEIEADIWKLKSIGIRGDENYLFYSKDGLGTAYYEKEESAKSAQNMRRYLSTPAARQKFFKAIDQLLTEIDHKASSLAKVDLSKLPDRQLYDLFQELWDLDGWAFTYSLATQPHRTRLFEQAAREAVAQKVAPAEVDSYLTSLTLSEKPTQLNLEQLDWLKLILKFRKTIAPDKLDASHLRQKHPEFYKQVEKHFERYKLLAFGDGNWNPSVDYFIGNLSRDYQKPLKDLTARYNELKNFSATTLKRRQKIIKDLKLDKATVETVELLAELGHQRLLLRTNGYIPVLFVAIPTQWEIEKRLGVSDYSLKFLKDKDEARAFYEHPTPAKIQQLRKRVTPDKEYLLLLKDGRFEAYYGAEAGKLFHKLVKPRVTKDTTELKGNVAMRGKVIDTATVFNWGDDMEQKLHELKQHPILIAGHTRPAMMPLIREAIGIVTDEGGVTSHAAIVSRELGIPSVINTKMATKVFKTGDKIELDAENGIVRKIQ